MQHKTISIHSAAPFLFSTGHLYASALYSMLKQMRQEATNPETRKELQSLMTEVTQFIQQQQPDSAALSALQEKLISHCNRHGYRDIQQLLTLVESPEWRQELSPETSAFVNKITHIFTPESYQIKTEAAKSPAILQPEPAYLAAVDALKHDSAAALVLPTQKHTLLVNGAFSDAIYKNPAFAERLTEAKNNVLAVADQAETQPVQIIELPPAKRSLFGAISKRLTKRSKIKAPKTDVLPSTEFIHDYLSVMPAKVLILNTPEQNYARVKTRFNESEQLQRLDEESLAETYKKASRTEKVNILTLLLVNHDTEKALALLDAKMDSTADTPARNEASPQALRQALHPALRQQLKHAKPDEKITPEAVTDLEHVLLRKNLPAPGLKWLTEEAKELLEKLKSDKADGGMTEEDMDALTEEDLTNLIQEKLMGGVARGKKEDNDNDPKTRFEKLGYVAKIPFDAVRPVHIAPYDLVQIAALRGTLQTEMDKIDSGHNAFKHDLINWTISVIKNPALQKNPLIIEGPMNFRKEKMVKIAIETGLGLPVKSFNLSKPQVADRLLESETALGKSQPGLLLDHMVKSGCANPYYIFKYVKEAGGAETPNLASLLGGEDSGHGDPLTELTDPTKNQNIRDEYLPQIPLDFSQAGVVITTKSREAVDETLRNRSAIISVDPQSRASKIENSMNYVLPKILTEKGYDPQEITISPKLMGYIIDRAFSEEDGHLSKIILAEVLDLASHQDDFVTPGYVLKKEDIDQVLQKLGMLGMHVTLPAESTVGQMASLAAGDGMGFVDFTQASVVSPKGGKVINTGIQGDMLAQSNYTARTVAGQILSTFLENQKTAITDMTLEIKPTTWESDGPSASALTAAVLVSTIADIPIKPTVSSTGELLLTHTIGPIGGLFYKLQAAKQTGITDVYICKANEKDLKEAQRHDPGLVDDTFQVHVIHTVEELIDATLDWSKSKWKDLNDLMTRG